jgi:phosphoglycerol transferase MdoB-like AlkP superfamily enzyme
MLDRLLYLAGYALYWLLFFLFFKAVFLIYNSYLAIELPLSEIVGIFWHGLPMDMSFTAYTLALPYLLIAVDTFVGLGNGRWLRPTLLVYNTALVFLYSFICTADLELYQAWGFRIDTSPLNYLNTPKEMFASVGSSPIWLLITLNIITNIFFSEFYKRTVHRLLPWKYQNYRLVGVPFLLLAGSLVIVMRGGLQTIPLKQSTVFFSNNYFSNQAALNAPWNFMYALNKYKNTDENPYKFMAPEEANQLVNSLYNQDSTQTTSNRTWLNTDRPNIVLIIWESFTAKVVEPLGGMPDVTPNFNKLSKEGILFTNMYASGDRSDKGLVAILSGYPAQPSQTIMKEPQKSRNLPQLSKTLNQAGYYNSFYYGGELDFANLRSFLHFGSYNSLVSDDDFAEEDRNSKWGAHDGVVANRLLADIDSFPQPFFCNWFTLSSHEPFEIPAEYKFGNQNSTEGFLSSHYYTDAVVGNFISTLQTKPWWNNTLVIIIADHGHPEPNNAQGFEPNKFTIPMLWLGGALNQTGRVESTLSQTDIAAMLLDEINLDRSVYTWSKNVLRGQPAFAQYVFNNGLAFVTDSAYIIQDNISRELIRESGNIQKLLPLGQAHLQKSYSDYLIR